MILDSPVWGRGRVIPGILRRGRQEGQSEETDRETQVKVTGFKEGEAGAPNHTMQWPHNRNRQGMDSPATASRRIAALLAP